MKREYTYTVHVVVDRGRAVDWWADGVITDQSYDLEGFVADAVIQYKDADAAAAEEAADMALEARKERQA